MISETVLDKVVLSLKIKQLLQVKFTPSEIIQSVRRNRVNKKKISFQYETTTKDKKLKVAVPMENLVRIKEKSFACLKLTQLKH